MCTIQFVADAGRLRHVQSDGQVRPEAWQVHGVLHALSRRHRVQGGERGHHGHQGQESRAVCRLVSDGLQGRPQLPAADGCARRRLGQSAARSLHAQQHDGHLCRVGAPQPQVRSDVRQARLRALVRGRGNGGGRVHRGARGLGLAREGLCRGDLKRQAVSVVVVALLIF